MKLVVDHIDTYVTVENQVDQKFLNAYSKKLSTLVPGAEYTWRYKRGGWDGRIKFLTHLKDGRYRFPTGFLPSFEEACPHISKIEWSPVNSLTLMETTVPLRDYQWEAAKALLENTFHGVWWPRGVIQAGTGGGKTEIAVALLEMLNVPSLFLVHRKDLVDQARKRLQKYGLTSGEIGDGTFNPDPLGITVATVQSLSRQVGTKRPKAGWLNLQTACQCIIIDEAHSIAANLDKGNTFTQVLSSFPNAFVRIGLTATPFMRDSYSNFLLEGFTGKLIYEISSRELIQRGVLEDAVITMVHMPKLSARDLKKMGSEKRMNRYQVAYRRAIEQNQERIEKIIELANQAPGPTLILVKTVAHGRNIQGIAENQGQTIEMIDGPTSKKDRASACARMVRNKSILIATGIYDEGIDIPELQTIILAAGGKSSGKNLQRLGRGLRKSKGKSSLNVIDFFDETRPLDIHSLERCKLWKNQGYIINDI